jgi:hypothetical protein
MAYENMSTAIARPTAANYHALLFVGVCNVERYPRSLIRWTNLLHDMYGYPLSNIRVLVGTYSSTSWPSMVAGADITYDATMADLDNALGAYASGSGDPHELGTDDNLFIFTFNHGGQDSTGCYLSCGSFSNKYYASDFAARIADIHCQQIVLLAAQCHSGGFVDPFINALWSGTRGAVMAGCRSDQVTYEAICDKLYASALNGRMVQDALDDNIDLGITGDGMGVYLVPGYHTDRVEWGPRGAISTREAFNWVYDHYIAGVRPAFSYVTEVPLYRQKPWTESGEPVHIRLGEPDLVMQDNSSDTGSEPSSGSPWHSPDLYADNSDQFPTVGSHEYVPAHDNRFFIRTANRGTAPTDRAWRYMEVRGLGFTGGPVGPPRLDLAVETVGGATASARLRPGRAHTQQQRIMIGDDLGHGCVSAACWCGTDELDHTLWSIRDDNDQVQCNLNPASISGSVPVTSASTSNAGAIVQIIPIVALEEGRFQLHVEEPKADFHITTKVEREWLELKRGQMAEFALEIALEEKVEDGLKGRLVVAVKRDETTLGGVTFLLRTATAYADVAVYDQRGRPVPEATVNLRYPGDPRVLSTHTDGQGIANFGPLNPGFYFAHTKGTKGPPVRLHIGEGRNRFKLTMERRPASRFAAAKR